MGELFDNQPKITPSSDADWKRYYQKKEIEADSQLRDAAWALAHMLRFAMNGQKEDAVMLARRMANRLKYPRDNQQIKDEIAKWPEFKGSVLRGDDHAAD